MNTGDKAKLITLKGSAKGITLHLKEDADFEELKVALEQHLTESADFFNKVDVSILLEGKKINKLEYSQLVDIIINKTPINCEKITANIGEKTLDLQNRVVDEVEFHHGTLRAGQRVQSDKNIVIMGDVNPSAEIVAKGNVIILGSLKGVAWAGYPEGKDNFIVAFDMQPMMLKIGQVFGRSDHSGNTKQRANNSGISFLIDDQITVEPMDYKAINSLLNKKNTEINDTQKS